jgi:hypothetical protein
MRVVKSHSVDDADNERSETSARDLAQVLEQSGEAVTRVGGRIPSLESGLSLGAVCAIWSAAIGPPEHPGWKLPMI